MSSWVRLWLDMPTDPKWRTIAKRSGQRLTDVISVFVILMTNTCNDSGNAEERNGTQRNATERTGTFTVSPDDISAALDLEEGSVIAILEAMQGKVLDGNRLTGWAQRQPKREDPTAKARKTAFKERQAEKRNATERTGTQRNAEERPDTDTETDPEYVDVVSARANFDLVQLTADLCRRGGVRNIDPSRIIAHQATVKEWLDEGFSIDLIQSVIAEGVAKATTPIHSIKYFGTAIRQAGAIQENEHDPSTRGRRSKGDTKHSTADALSAARDRLGLDPIKV